MTVRIASPGRVAAEVILDLLPQTQCGQCGFPGCRPYAEAIAAHQAPINLCPPGGLETLKQLAELTHQDMKPLEALLCARIKPKQIAVIREEACIGCTKCLRACPVDAIYGAAKQMHVVFALECTGCGLCVDPCPVDCIDMVNVSALQYDKQAARKAYEAKLGRGDFQRAGMLAVAEKNKPIAPIVLDRKRLITEAVARARAKR